MLTELNDVQESDERVWGTADLSFSIRTRSEDGDELVERTYTFSHAKEWDKWTFYHFEERRTPDTDTVSCRRWRRTKDVYWDETEQPVEDVPPEVSDKLAELLNVDEVVLQLP